MMGEIVQFFRVAFGLIFLFFVPGFAFSLVLFPKKGDLSLTLRIGLSGALSVVIDVLTTLFIDLALHMPTTGFNIFASLLTFTLFCLALWRFEIFVFSRYSGKFTKKADEN